MNDLLNIKIMNMEAWRYIALFGVILAALIARIIFKYIMHSHIKKLTAKTKTEFDDRLIDAIIPPVSNIFYLIGLYTISKLLFIPEQYIKYLNMTLNLLIGLNIAYFAFRFIDVVELYLLKISERTDNALDDQFVGTIRKTLKLVVIIISAIVIADNLGYNVSGLIAGLGIGGLAIALAAQDSIANIFGSITVILDKPFQVNERIRILGFDGNIEKIGLRSTRLRTLDGHLVTIPNKELTNAAVENVTERPTIKFLSTIGLVYSTSSVKMKMALQIIKDILKAEEHVDEEFHVNFTKFNDYSLDIQLVYWVSPADYWLSLDSTERVNLAIKERFEAEGIEMAFPTQTIEMTS